MNGIIGLTGLVLEGELQPEQREHLTLVQKSAEHAAAHHQRHPRHLEDRGRAPGHRRDSVSSAETARRRLKILELRAGEKGLAFNADVAPDVPDSVVGDWARLQQILTNLVGNAIKFTERGRITVRLAVEGQAQGPSTALGAGPRLRWGQATRSCVFRSSTRASAFLPNGRRRCSIRLRRLMARRRGALAGPAWA